MKKTYTDTNSYKEYDKVRLKNGMTGIILDLRPDLDGYIVEGDDNEIYCVDRKDLEGHVDDKNC